MKYGRKMGFLPPLIIQQDLPSKFKHEGGRRKERPKSGDLGRDLFFHQNDGRVDGRTPDNGTSKEPKRNETKVLLL